MSGKVQGFSTGDWIFHPAHGVGRIKKVENKRIEGEKTRFLRVENDDATYWVPADEIDASRIRKLASRAQFRRAIHLLRKTPRDMNPNYSKRKSRIEKAKFGGSLREGIRVVRDLWARRRNKGLSYNDKRALRQFIDNLVEEWSIAEEISTDDARTELYDLLKNGSFGLEEAGPPSQVEEIVERE
ncbi:MAG: CarD family transcriptional regulator [Candidatus Binatia bacterium]